MNDLEKTVHLVSRAVELHGPEVRPCHGKARFRDCITVHNGKAMLWYNSEDNSTHIVSMMAEE